MTENHTNPITAIVMTPKMIEDVHRRFGSDAKPSVVCDDEHKFDLDNLEVTMDGLHEALMEDHQGTEDELHEAYQPWRELARWVRAIRLVIINELAESL